VELLNWVFPDGLGILLNVCTIPSFLRGDPFDVRINQAANGVITSFEALTKMLDLIHYFINRLRIYAETSEPMLAVDEIVIKLMVELMFTLGLVAQKLEKRRSREYFLVYVLFHSAPRSQMGKEFLRGP
jgi:hypothetical protein